MANNTNPQAVAFSNSKIRPLADMLNALYWTAKSVSSQWTSQGLAALVPNDANFIQDGATVGAGTPDGRTPITNADINVLLAKATDFIAYCEGSSGTPTNDNSKQNLNQIAKVQVNGTAKL